MPRSDQEIVEFVKECLATCEPGFKDAEVVDSAVLRFSGMGRGMLFVCFAALGTECDMRTASYLGLKHQFLLLSAAGGGGASFDSASTCLLSFMWDYLT